MSEASLESGMSIVYGMEAVLGGCESSSPRCNIYGVYDLKHSAVRAAELFERKIRESLRFELTRPSQASLPRYNTSPSPRRFPP